MQIFDLYGILELRGVENITRQMNTMGNNISKVGKGITDFGMGLVNNVTMPIVGFFGASAKASMDFNQQLANTGAVSNASAKEMDGLRDQAMKLGKDTKYSALEVAQGQEQMIKAGRNLNQTFDEMDDVLNLAAAGGIEVAEAAETGSNMLNMFSKQGITMEDVANQMAGAANASATDVKGLAYSLKYVGPIAASLNIPFSDVTATLGVLANNGLKGTSAGTGLRQMLTRLQPASKAASAAFTELGLITADGGNIFYDATGKLKPMNDIIGILNEKMGTLTDQQRSAKLKDMFGLIASPTINTLLKAGAGAIGEMADNIGKVTAAEVATKKLNTMAGSIEFLQGSWETLLIKVGSLLEPFFRKVIDFASMIMNKFLGLNDAVMVVIIAFLAVIAAIGPLIVVLGTVITMVGFLITAISAIIPVLTAIATPLAIAAAILGTLGAAIGYVVWSLGYLSDGIQIVKAFFSGDIQTVFNMFVNVLKMSKESAQDLTEKLLSIKEKGSIVFQWLGQNVGPIFGVIKDAITSIDFSKFDNSTKNSRSFFTEFISTVIKDVSQFTTYMYKLLDSFGLLPVKLKYQNDQVAGKYVELHAIVSKNLGDIYNANLMFNQLTYQADVDRYTKKIETTKTSLDKEYNTVVNALNKKRDTELQHMNTLMSETLGVDFAHRQTMLEKTKQYYVDQENQLKWNNIKIKEIMTIAGNEKRELTEKEQKTIEHIREHSEKTQVGIVTNGKTTQARILLDAKNLTTANAKEEALQVIAEANRTYDTIIQKEKKKRDDKIALAITARDQTGALSKQEADTIISNANKQFDGVVKSARDTKNATISIASERVGGTITAAQKEAREVNTQADKIKKVMLQVWDDLKKQIPGKIAELGGIVVSAVTSSIVKAVGNLLSDMMKSIADFGSSSSSLSTSKIRKNAKGTRNFSGGLTLVGEEGPELVNLPRGSDIYSNPETMSMLQPQSSFTATQGTTNVHVSVTGNNIWDHRAVDELGTKLVGKLKGVINNAY